MGNIRFSLCSAQSVNVKGLARRVAPAVGVMPVGGCGALFLPN